MAHKLRIPLPLFRIRSLVDPRRFSQLNLSLSLTTNIHTLQLRQVHQYTAPISAHEICARMVREFDHDQFLINLLLPEPARRAHMAIRALYIELSRLHGALRARYGSMASRDPTKHGANAFLSATKMDATQLRLAWYSVAIREAAQGTPPKGAPVLEAIAEVMEKHKLSRMWFQKMIDSAEDVVRASVSKHSIWKDWDELERHLENRVSSPIYLTLECLDVRNRICDHAASHLGKALGLVNLIVDSPWAALENRILVPASLLKEKGADEDFSIRRMMRALDTNLSESSSQLLVGYSKGEEDRQHDAWKNVFFELAVRAKSHLEAARTFIPDIQKQALLNTGFYAFLVSPIIELYLKDLEKRSDFDPIYFIKHPMNPLRVQFHLLKQRLRKSF